MTSVECVLEVMEQPAERVKFRTEVHGHRCQQRELLLGQTVMPDETVAFPKVRLVPKPGQALRPSTMVRMSLVDIRSSSEDIVDHWHRLVDCREEKLLPRWSVVRSLEMPYGWATFSNLGIVRSLERDRGREVGQRAVERAGEQNVSVRSDRHLQLELKDRAEARCRETCAFRLKLCFEAFIQAQDGTIVQVAEPVFSNNILDETRPEKAGELPVEKISICSDFVEGGNEVMAFVGNWTTRIPLKQSNFFVEFFELDNVEEEQQKKWKSGRTQIPKCDLHGLGQILGGLSFKVPAFDRDSPGSGRACSIDQPTENVFFEIVKTNKAGKEEAKSDPIFFTYTPSRLTTTTRKRGQERNEFLEMKLPKLEASTPFIPTFSYSLSEPTVTITNMPITDPRIPTLVESLGHQTTLPPQHQAHLDLLGSESREEQPLYQNALSPATGLSQLHLNSPQPVSPNQSSSHNLSSSPTPPRLNCPPSSPYLHHRQHHNPLEKQQELNEENMDDFIKSILAPDPPRLSDLGGDIFFDGSTRSGTVCVDSSTQSETVSESENTEKTTTGDETEGKKSSVCKEVEAKECKKESEDLTESLTKLDISQ